MKEVVEETYRGWNISVTAQQEQCAHFSFDSTDPSGHKQTVKMGGDNEKRALERAREMVDMEIDFAGEN
jgi:hypothetical protein